METLTTIFGFLAVFLLAFVTGFCLVYFGLLTIAALHDLWIYVKPLFGKRIKEKE